MADASTRKRSRSVTEDGAGSSESTQLFLRVGWE